MKAKEGTYPDYGSMDGVREIFTGFFVGSEAKISMPHPDPCIVLMDDQERVLGRIGSGFLLIFSCKEKAESFIKEVGMEERLFPEVFPWETLVKKFKAGFEMAILDQTREGIAFQMIPLVLGI